VGVGRDKLHSKGETSTKRERGGADLSLEKLQLRDIPLPLCHLYETHGNI